MRIFVGFGYNDKDRWIKEKVIPMIRSFGIEVETGEDMHGEILSQGVIERIKSCDGLLAFLTRRQKLIDENNKEVYTTHKWVTDELSCAINNHIPAVEIRETLVDPQTGISGDRQRIDLDTADKEDLYIQLSAVLNRWKRKHNARRIQLLPQELVQVIKPSKFDDFTCQYRYMVGAREYDYKTARLKRVASGLCIDIQEIPSEDAFIEVVIKGAGLEYRTAFEPLYMKFIMQPE